MKRVITVLIFLFNLLGCSNQESVKEIDQIDHLIASLDSTKNALKNETNLKDNILIDKDNALRDKELLILQLDSVQNNLISLRSQVNNEEMNKEEIKRALSIIINKGQNIKKAAERFSYLVKENSSLSNDNNTLVGKNQNLIDENGSLLQENNKLKNHIGNNQQTSSNKITELENLVYNLSNQILKLKFSDSIKSDSLALVIEGVKERLNKEIIEKENIEDNVIVIDEVLPFPKFFKRFPKIINGVSFEGKKTKGITLIVESIATPGKDKNKSRVDTVYINYFYILKGGKRQFIESTPITIDGNDLYCSRWVYIRIGQKKSEYFDLTLYSKFYPGDHEIEIFYYGKNRTRYSKKFPFTIF